MAFKMKGAPMHDLSSKHGTNANYKKSGAPGLMDIGKKLLDPLGLFKKRGGKGGACPPQQAAAAQVPAAAPAEPVAPGAGPAGAASPAAPVEEEMAAAPMKEGLMKASPAKDKKSWTAAEWQDPKNPWIAKDEHNKAHDRGDFDSNHKKPEKSKEIKALTKRRDALKESNKKLKAKNN